jgi:hypothetical protein
VAGMVGVLSTFCVDSIGVGNGFSKPGAESGRFRFAVCVSTSTGCVDEEGWECSVDKELLRGGWIPPSIGDPIDDVE